MRWGHFLLPVLLSSVLLAACSGPAGPYDTDEDGTVDPDDCAPTDPTIHTGAPETANDIDDDCDGSIDEGTAGYDDDGDGWCEGFDYGDGEPSCADGTEPGDCDDTHAGLDPGDADGDGQSTCEGDCDDGEAARWIGNAEVCDGLDNDCDGTLSLDEQDTDGDGATPCDGDCDDGDPDANILDEDADGFSTCEQDCDDGDPELTPGDADGDGWSSCLGDCDDLSPLVHPEQVEVCDHVFDADCLLDEDDEDGDGVDADGDGDPACSDCDDGDPAQSGVDVDGDGFSSCGDPADCNDLVAGIAPGLDDLFGDEVDANCDGIDGVDGDEDGFASVESGGPDCDDGDPAMHPADADGDGSSLCDGDCDDTDDTVEALDVDGDGVTTCDGDCDDADPLRAPGFAEACDLVPDSDCDGSNDEVGDGVDADSDGDPACSDCDDVDPFSHTLDADGDGYSACEGDCNDAVSSTHPAATDSWGDTIDSNCDGLDGVDADDDGFAGNASAPFTDCNDADPDLNLDDADGDGSTTCDGDCDDNDGSVEALDADGDGVTTCDGPPDCRDDQPTVFPGAVEVCDPWDTDCDPATALPDDGVDADGDGFAPCDDCDDGNPDTWPGAPEICDGEDNDCSGGFPIHGPDGEWDNDGDGFSDCEGDCGDFDDTVHPGAIDNCDGEDTDCDGIVDNLGDSDGDGWCAGDCDDGDPARHPGQWETVDGVDSDCDGTDFTGLDQEAWAIVDGAQDVLAGSSLAGGGDIDGDIFPDILVGAPASGTSPATQARACLFRGVDLQASTSSPLSLLTDPWACLGGTHPAWGGVRAGASVAFLPDVDGDGLDEVAWGSPDIRNSLNYAQGAVYVEFSADLVPGGWPDHGAANVEIGNVVGMDFGETLATGDVDGDGLGDLLVGGNWDSGAFLFLGSTLQAGGSFMSTDADVHFTGPWDQYAPVKVDMDDFDDDGFSDIAFGHWNTGSTWLFYGYQLEQTPTWDMADAHLTMTGGGSSVAFVPDMDGDGLGELAVGGMGSGIGGTVWLISSDQLLTMGTLAPGDAWARIESTTSWAYFGTDVASADDLDGDGLGDLLVGAWQLPGGSDGGAWAFLGSTLAAGGAFADTDGDFAFAAADTDYHRVAPAGDLNADGAPDLLVANPEWEWDDRGRVWLLLNPL